MEVRFTAEAESQLQSRRIWWREHRDHADLFDEELTDAVARISEAPSSFPWFGIRQGRLVRRCLMEKTGCHLYFEVDVAVGVITVVLAWGAIRGREPPL
jgi:hypothetical protein